MHPPFFLREGEKEQERCMQYLTHWPTPEMSTTTVTKLDGILHWEFNPDLHGWQSQTLALTLLPPRICFSKKLVLDFRAMPSNMGYKNVTQLVRTLAQSHHNKTQLSYNLKWNQNSENISSIWSTHSLPKICLKEIKSVYERIHCIPRFIAVWLTIARIWNQYVCPWIDD